MPQIHDEYANQVVHMHFYRRVFHVSVSGDQCKALCLETGDQVQGNSRQECLDAMNAKLLVKFAGTDMGVTA